MATPMLGRARSNAISGSRDFLALKPTDVELQMLENARRDGLIRGVTLLSKMTCDVEALVWAGLRGAATTTAGGMSYGYASSAPAALAIDRASSGVGEVGPGTVANFLEWAYAKAADKIVSNEWVQRLVKAFGIGLSVLLDWIKKTILNADLIKALIPLYGPVKGLIDTGIRIYDAASASNALNRILQAAPQIGSGLPTVMFRQLSEYLSREVALNAGKAVYNFGKSLVTVLVGVFAAPAASALSLITSIIEAITSFVYLVFQGLTFKSATDKCREWVKVGDFDQDLDFSDGIAACPFIGCAFFGAANYMGHFNLSAMLTKPRLLTSANLTLAVGEVSAVQKVACQYVKSTEVPFKIDSEYDWVLKMMRGYASDAPRSEFLTEDASAKVRFVHFGKKGLRKAKTVGRKIYGFLG
jgi:hypothetical protein